jgi:hypothetical protein
MGSRGPLPEPDSFRSERLQTSVGGWTMLPAAGRKGDPPAWPLRRYSSSRGQDPDAVAESEAAYWAILWRMPQAVAWEELGCEHLVGLYCRLTALAEGGQISAAGEARQLADRLGLSHMSMARLRWRISEERPTRRGNGDQAAERAALTEMRAPARDRLEAMDGDQLRPRRLRARRVVTAEGA